MSSAGARPPLLTLERLPVPDTAYSAAFRRAGILRATTMTHVSNLPMRLTTQPIPKGKRTAVVTNAGGLGIVATDAIDPGGLEMGSLSARTQLLCCARNASYGQHM